MIIKSFTVKNTDEVQEWVMQMSQKLCYTF